MDEEIALINYEDIRKYAFHNDESIDVTIYTPEFIHGVQIECIKPIFPDVYDVLESKLLLNSELSDLESRFIRKIKHPLSLFCRVKMLPQRHVQETNSGAALIEGDHFRQSEIKRVSILSDSIENTAIELINNALKWYEDQSEFEDKPAEDNIDYDIIF